MTHRVVRAICASVIGLSLSLGCLGPLPQATAATISWGTAQTISGDSDVNTTGTLVSAFSMGTTSVPQTTVNGVTFAPFGIGGGFVQSVNVGDVTLTEAPGALFAYDTFGTGTAPFSGLSSGYQSLIGTGGYANNIATLSVTIAGLTPGQDYLVQWWTNNSALLSPVDGGSFTNTIADSTGVSLDPNTTDVLGGVGQYAVGTFTADATSQVFTLEGTNSGYVPLINGLQVRAVPEPATCMLALAGLAAGGRVVWHRRKRAKRPPGSVTGGLDRE